MKVQVSVHLMLHAQVSVVATVDIQRPVPFVQVCITGHKYNNV